MNITPSNIQPRYITPDINIVHTSRTELTQKTFQGKNLYLAPMANQLVVLKEHLDAVEYCSREMLAVAPVVLQTQTVVELLSDMQNAAGMRSSTDAEAVAESFQDEINNHIERTLESVGTQASTLSNLLDSLSEHTIADSTQFMASEQTRHAELERILDAATRHRDKLQADKDGINEAMRVYEEMTLFDRWTPILKDALRFKLANPQLIALQAGVAGVKNILQIASEMVHYEHLVEAQTRVHEILQKEHAQLTEYRDQINILNDRIRQLNNVKGIEGIKQRYEQEMRKLPDALNAFLESCQRQGYPLASDFFRTYVAQADALSAWLADIGKKWR